MIDIFGSFSLITQQIHPGSSLEREIHPTIYACEQNQAATAGSVKTNVPIQLPHRRYL